eukprot:scaffold82822_cov17-Tisochrysis_lutea.AAC.1
MEMLMRKYVFPSDAHRISAVIQVLNPIPGAHHANRGSAAIQVRGMCCYVSRFHTPLPWCTSYAHRGPAAIQVHDAYSGAYRLSHLCLMYTMLIEDLWSSRSVGGIDACCRRIPDLEENMPSVKAQPPPK